MTASRKASVLGLMLTMAIRVCARNVQFAYYPSYGFIRLRIEGDLFRTPDGTAGLRGEYYPNVRLTGEPVMVRTDGVPVLIRRGTRAPADGMPDENWSARWTGMFGPVPQSGGYEFITWTDDGVRLWVGGQMVVDDWHPHPPQYNRAQVILEKGVTVPIRLEFYQGVGGATCHLMARLLDPVTDRGCEAEVTVTDSTGKVWCAQTIAWSPAGSEERIQVGRLPAGIYELKVVTEPGREPWRATFERIVFPWEGTHLGVTTDVYPPFRPIEVEGRTVRVVLREYRLGGLGLWDSVRAAGNVSAGGPEELLAAPLTVCVNGGESLSGEGDFVRARRRVMVGRDSNQRPIFKEESYLPEHAVIYEGRAVHPAVTVSTRCTTEYDGCMAVEMTLGPGSQGAVLEKLWLEIPVRDCLAPLFHVTAAGLRENPAGATPAGTGLVWDSRVKIPATQGSSYVGNFKPYLWVGAEERGLCWFADNDAGWVLDLERDSPCLTLAREGDRLVLRVHLVQKAVHLQTPRRIVFGLMASPAKPMPEEWRRLLPGQRFKHFRSRIFTMNYAADGIYACKYPSHADFSIFNIIQALRWGAPVEDPWQAWRCQNEQRWSPYLKDERFRRLVETLTRVARQQPDLLTMYFEEFTQTHATHPEAHVFQSEWSGEYHTPLLRQVTKEWERLASIRTGALAPSYRDFACWYAAEWIRRGIGCYFDNAFPIGVTDPVTTSAYVLEDGRLQPSAGLWSRRDYLRRIWVLHRQMSPRLMRPLMMVHMTNTHILPYLVWNECNLDLEWGDERPLQAQWSPELLRVQSIGRQSGNLPLAMPTARNGMLVMLIHEAGMFTALPSPEFVELLADWHYGLPDCRVFNYWDTGAPVEVNDSRVKWLLLEHGGRLLLLVCTWNPDEAEVVLTLDTRLLGVAVSQATDVLNPDSPVQLKNGHVLATRLPGYGVRVLRIE